MLLPLPSVARRAAGFTLLEILVVMALLGIVLGIAVVRLDDGGERVTRTRAEELGLRLEAARDEAVYAGQPLAFSTDGEGYKFWRGDTARQQWFALAQNAGELAPRALGEDVRIVAQTVNGQPRPLGERLVFNADGMTDPFVLVVQGRARALRVEGDALGRVSVDAEATRAD
ncbi:MAG: GspH/FimT family pseudopilin [Candidatus Dactylopiibacterium sp.]|nr:GspH/FimT family pseudopilin [Candidatus Dactylopiibacterium sp.]